MSDMSHHAYPSTARPNDIALMAEAGGNIARAVSLQAMHAEGFDGEEIIALGAEVGLRERLGFSATDARRRLVKAQAAEDALYGSLA